MKRFVRALFTTISLFGASLFAVVSCAPTQQQPVATTQAEAANTPPAGFPANLRWDLVPKWIQWADAKAQISWPPNDGCEAAPVARSLPAGELIDRFGSEGGTFFSPKGESYQSRAVPYICRKMDYWVYRVARPLAVKSCKAAPWFNEPGGAIQVQTAGPAYKLVADGTLEVVSHAVGGSGGPDPQCGRP
jgi:Tuberculosis necrotizing toxin